MELREVTYLAVIVRLAAAVIFGGLIGLERGIKTARQVFVPICW